MKLFLCHAFLSAIFFEVIPGYFCFLSTLRVIRYYDPLALWKACWHNENCFLYLKYLRGKRNEYFPPHCGVRGLTANLIIKYNKKENPCVPHFIITIMRRITHDWRCHNGTSAEYVHRFIFKYQTHFFRLDFSRGSRREVVDFDLNVLYELMIILAQEAC